MTREEIINDVQNIFRDIFGDNKLVINENMTSSDIEEWDSLNHLNLISSIEDEFKIKFALGELTSLKDIGSMINLVSTKLS